MKMVPAQKEGWCVLCQSKIRTWDQITKRTCDTRWVHWKCAKSSPRPSAPRPRFTIKEKQPDGLELARWMYHQYKDNGGAGLSPRPSGHR